MGDGIIAGDAEAETELVRQRLDRTFQGLDAVVVHHEMDHLDGVLFIARVQSIEDLYQVRVDADGTGSCSGTGDVSIIAEGINCCRAIMGGIRCDTRFKQG